DVGQDGHRALAVGDALSETQAAKELGLLDAKLHGAAPRLLLPDSLSYRDPVVVIGPVNIWMNGSSCWKRKPFSVSGALTGCVVPCGYRRQLGSLPGRPQSRTARFTGCLTGWATA